MLLGFDKLLEEIKKRRKKETAQHMKFFAYLFDFLHMFASQTLYMLMQYINF